MSAKPSVSFWKVIGLLAVFSIAPLSLYLMYYRTGGPASQKELALQKNLRFAFMAGTATVELAPLSPWPWVKVCAVTNGLSSDQLTKVIGFPYKDYDQLHWLPRPELWTLLFIDSERQANWGEAIPVTPIRVPRKEVANLTLPKGADGVCVSRHQGRLFLDRKTDAPVGASPVVVSLGPPPSPPAPEPETPNPPVE